jgi:hypothetical protein
MQKTLLMLATLSAVAARAVDFETPPAEPASASLTADMVSGPNFHIVEPVVVDGLMHHYVIDSRFGTFTAYGQVALKIRLREVAALAQISKTTDLDVITKSVSRRVETDAKTLREAATHPVGLVTGIPKGIGHLFGGYKAQAKEFTEKSNSTDGTNGGSIVTHAAANATSYADRYLGVSAAERRYYQQLGVDPYTNNDVLRRAVRHLAQVDATANLGMHFIGIPGVPYLGDVKRAMDAIYNEDPAVLRARQRAALASYGLSADEIKRFENTLLLSPTRQNLLAQVAKSLNGVAGRDELFRHAMSLTSDEEVQIFLQSTGLLVSLHAHRPVARILSGLRLPAAQFNDGRLVVLGAFDSIYWTEDVAGYESSLHALLPDAPMGLEVWSSGTISSRARAELTNRGWDVHDNANEALSSVGTIEGKGNGL